MSAKLIRVWVVTVMAAASVAVLSAGAFGRAGAHADLRILSGSVKRTGGTRAQPVLTGSFKVANVGNASTRAVRAWVELRAAGKPAKIVTRFAAVPLKAGRRITLRAEVKLPRDLAKVDWTVEFCVALGESLETKPAKVGCRKLAAYDLASKVASVVPEPISTTPATTTITPATAPTSTSPATAATSTTPATTSTATTPTSSTPTTSTTATTPTTPSPPAGPVSTVPAQPLTDYTTNSPDWVADGLGQYERTANDAGADPTSYGGYFTSGYYVVVPPSYDETNETPETLVVWMHGCYGTAHWDAQDLTAQYDSDRSYILISLSGPEDTDGSAGPSCWDTGDQTDVNKVLTDVANVETHFNINRRRVIIAGYSSGGDLAYQTIFTHADTFAGILADNTNPVRDNTFGAAYGLDAINDAIAGAAWKFPIRQLSHTDDDIYHVDRCGYSGTPACPTGDPSGSTDPDAGVRPAIQALQNSGFPVTFTIIAGNHYNADTPNDCNDYTPGDCTGGDGFQIVHDLLNDIATDGWEAPAS